ncbi:MAG: Rpn family recombination-promoting nuclease/putative transposase [Synergistaceae bacterium]|nr:Rpn family recombination-promoting nuclease/putative transposase [Synergistaceae bacterium]MBQ3654078.1 Rpn family recombination-promoting nuclease/putative transposase [Synergistaceae bacterium]
MKTSVEYSDLIAAPINRLSDSFFKFVLASPERKHITIAFLNAVLNHYVPAGEKPIEIEDVEFLDRETAAHVEGLKSSRFDVFARSKDGRRFHIEVQNVKEKFFMKRSFYYAASDYMTQLEHGMSYERLEPVIFIGLMNFTLFGSPERPEKWYSLHRFMNVESHEHTFSEVEFHMVEMPLLRRYLAKTEIKPKDYFEEILCYFGNIGGDELMEEIAERNPTVAELRLAESIFRKDPIAFRNYLINERARIDEEYNRRYEREESREEGREEGRRKGLEEGRAEGREVGLAEGREVGLAEGREVGLAEGREVGLAESRNDIARSLRLQGILTDEQIAQAVNMPVELVAKL